MGISILLETTLRQLPHDNPIERHNSARPASSRLLTMTTDSKNEAAFDQEHNDSPPGGSGSAAADFAERVPFNQRKHGSELEPHYDFIVCASGSCSSVVDRRIAANH